MEATIGIERWRRHYNEERPHMSLGDLTPAEFKAQLETTRCGPGRRVTESSRDMGNTFSHT